MLIRAATAADWPALWALMQPIVAAGETFSWDRDTTEATARAMWMTEPPRRTFVAVDDEGTIVGTAEMGPNRRGGGAHVGTAGFMVDATASGRGAGRALGEHVIAQARTDGYRAIQFNAVVETNTRAVALWRSLGFDVVATLPEAFAHPQHGFVGLHVMYLRLPAPGE
jgi:L-amino acid N-acyltransferase YncA